jgi:arginase
MILNRPITVIDAPSNLGLKPPVPGREPGVKGLARALREAGIVAGLNATDGGAVVPPPYAPDIDPATGVRNSQALGEYAIALAERVGHLLGEGSFPLVLGGDCSILLGDMLALRRRGRYGLVFIDGHTDFLHPPTQTGGAAGMDLALVCGRGPESLTNLSGLRPLVRERDVVVIGNRDIEDRETYEAKNIFETEIAIYDLGAFRELGAEEVVAQSLRRLAENGAGEFWIHLDADALDSEIMPAVDSPAPGGMSYEELTGLIAALLGSGRAAGMEVTVFDPDLDPGGSIARAFTEAIVSSFNAGSS